MEPITTDAVFSSSLPVELGPPRSLYEVSMSVGWRQEAKQRGLRAAVVAASSMDAWDRVASELEQANPGLVIDRRQLCGTVTTLAATDNDGRDDRKLLL